MSRLLFSPNRRVDACDYRKRYLAKLTRICSLTLELLTPTWPPLSGTPRADVAGNLTTFIAVHNNTGRYYQPSFIGRTPPAIQCQGTDLVVCFSKADSSRLSQRVSAYGLR